MKRKIILLLLLLLAAGAVFAVMWIRLPFPRNNFARLRALRGDAFDFSSVYLKRVDWSSAGDSLGGRETVMLRIAPDARGNPKAYVDYCTQKTHRSIPFRITVRVPSSAVAEAAGIIERYGMTEWKERPTDEDGSVPHALDAASTTLRFSYSDGRKNQIDSRSEIPEDGYGAAREIRDAILAAAGIREP